jgi:hypothetical protein
MTLEDGGRRYPDQSATLEYCPLLSTCRMWTNLGVPPMPRHKLARERPLSTRSILHQLTTRKLSYSISCFQLCHQAQGLSPFVLMLRRRLKRGQAMRLKSARVSRFVTTERAVVVKSNSCWIENKDCTEPYSTVLHGGPTVGDGFSNLTYTSPIRVAPQADASPACRIATLISTYGC